jgi:hypothetical protein
VLPWPGEVLVQPGQKVEAKSVVARTEIPGRYQVINIARQLGQLQPDMAEVMVVEEDDEVKAGQVIAASKGGLFRRSVKSPATGYIAAIGPGWVLLETEQIAIEVKAFITGSVARVLADQGVIIEANGAMIEAACGFGGEAFGRLKRLANSPYEMLDVAAIDESAGGSIVLAGRTLDEETLHRAEDWQIRGLIVGSIPASLLKLDPPAKAVVVATEGFGHGPMSPYTFGVLTSLSRREVSIRGSVSHLSGLPGPLRQEEPPVIIATDSSRGANYTAAAPAKSQQSPEVTVGSRVRVIQGELLGANGVIESIPSQPQATAAGIIAPGANVKFSHELFFIPWANLEQIG